MISAPEGSFITEDGSLVAADGTYLTIGRSAYIHILKGTVYCYIFDCNLRFVSCNITHRSVTCMLDLFVCVCFMCLSLYFCLGTSLYFNFNVFIRKIFALSDMMYIISLSENFC